MKVKVRLELTMSKYRREGERECFAELAAGARVRDLLEYFHIPETEPVLVVKNGRTAGHGDVLNPSDELIILPLLEGG